MSLFTTFNGSDVSSGAGLWTRAHLHALMHDLAGRPTTDESLTEALKDTLLTAEQARWYSIVASVAPEALYGPPTELRTDDDGESYYFGKDDAGRYVHPFGHVELLQGRRGGPIVLPGVSWAPQGFLIEGGVIRWADGRPHRFTGGLYGRYIAAPNVIDRDHEPTLQPPEARLLMVYGALAKWARRVRRDPREFIDLEKEAWFGSPAEGDHGLLGRLRTQYNLIGAQAVAEDAGRWWDSPDLDPLGPAWYRTR